MAFETQLFLIPKNGILKMLQVLTMSMVSILSGYMSYGQYNPGKLAVIVVGDGTSALSSAAAPVFIKEFNINGSGQSGTLRTSLPTVAVSGTSSVNRALTQSGTSTSEGFLNLSADRQLLTLTGYNCNSGTASVSSTTTILNFPTNVRVVGRVDATGAADTKTTVPTAYSSTSIRSSATIDGTGFWTAGGNGMYYIPNGNVTSIAALASTNTRGISVFNNQLYVSSASTSLRLCTVGAGLPTSGSPTVTNLAGYPTTTTDPNSYTLIDINGGGPDVLYVASLNATPTGLLKYTSSDNGANWTSSGSLTGNPFGITGYYNSCSGNVDLFITSNTANAKPNSLYKFSDLSVTVASPANITSNGSALSSVGTLLATATANTAFGGVAFTPATMLTTPAIFNVTGGNGCTNPGVNIGLSNSEKGVSYQLFNGFTPVGSAVAGTSSSLSFGTHSTAGTYSVTATNVLTGCTANMTGNAIVNNLPSVSISGLPDQFCQNDPPLVLSGTGNPGGGTFSGLAVINNYFVPVNAPLGSQTITYTYTDANGCSNSASKDVIVNSIPVISFSGLNSSYCVNASPATITLSHVGLVTGPGITDHGDGTASFNPSVAGAGGPYTISFTFTNTETGCTGTYSQTVTVYATPTVSIGASASTICTGGSSNLTLNFTGTAPWTYSIDGAAPIATSVNPLTIPANPSATTTYTVTSLSDVNCSAGEWLSVATGGSHALAIRADGSLWGWGRNNEGQLGQGVNYVDTSKPLRIGASNDWAVIAAGPGFSMAIKNNGTLWTWGDNFYGQMANGTFVGTFNTPQQVGTATNWSKVAAGNTSCLALKTDGTIWGWGSNSSGNLGDGSNISRSTPVQAGSATDWVDVSTGLNHTLALKSNGTLWGWGSGTVGQLAGASGNFPQQIGTQTDWAKICAGQQNSFAIKTTGTLWAWGWNQNGELGLNHFIQMSTPTQVGSATTWQSVSFRSGTSMATRQNGTRWASGINQFGGFGNGTETYSNSIIQCGAVSDWIKIAAGLRNGFGIRSDKTLWAWGENNSYGQLGDGTNINRLDPVQVNVPLSSVTITVNPLPLVSFSGLAVSYCLNESSVTLTGSPAGGTFNGPGVTGNTFNPAEAGEGGPYTITYSYTDPVTSCSNSSTKTVNVYLPMSFTGLASQYCVNAAPVTLTGSQPNVSQFSGPGIVGNTFNPALAGVGGPYTITYQHLVFDPDEEINCSNTYTQTVTIIELPSVSFTGLATSYCINALPVTLTGTPAGGSFSGPGISGNVFNPASAGVGGPYTIVYTYTDPGSGCTNTSSQTVTVNALPNVGFSGLPASVCANTAAIPLTGSPAAGTFSGPGISGNTFDPAAAGVGGPYTITYSYTDPGTGCSNSISQAVTVASNPSVNISGDNYVCFNGSSLLTANVTPGAGSVTGYQWVVTTLFGSTNLGTAPTQVTVQGGDHTVTITDSYGCTATSPVFNVTSFGPVTPNFTGLTSQYCSTDAPVLLTGNYPGGTFSGPGITDHLNGTATFNPAAAGTGGPYTITYSYTILPTTCSGNTSQQVSVITCAPLFATLNLTAFLEGFHYDINTMRANIYDLGISSISNETDTLLVGLWAPANLTNPSPDFSMQTVVHTDGSCIPMQFPAAVAGNSFFIQVKHRNHIETWSAAPVTFTASTSYDFTTSQAQAFDDGFDANPPMAPVAGGKFAFYAGDVNQDGGVDGQDASALEIDVNAFAFGYNASDANGDGSSDGLDASVIEVNANLFIFYSRP